MGNLLPELHKWDGGGIVCDSWSLGWVTGIHGDMVCVKRSVQTELIFPGHDWVLSPVCTCRLLAIVGFVCKTVLVQIDENIKSQSVAL